MILCEITLLLIDSLIYFNKDHFTIYFLLGQPRLDMPEILWKAYIDFEIEQEETDRARDLYKRLLNRTQHVKVWLSFAQFELQVLHIKANFD